MLVFSMVILLITKINSEHVVIEPKVIDEAPSAKYLARSKDLLSRRKQQEIHKVNKLVPNFPNEVLPVDSENEFPLDFEEGKALLENRDAEIGSSQNKAIKRFVPNNDSIFSPLLQRRNGNDKDVGDPTSVVHLKRENKGNRIKTKAKKRKRDIFDASKTNIRSIKTDREEVLSDLIELKPALDELFDEQNYKNHDTLESLDQKPHRECAKKHKINLPIGYTESVLSEEGEEEEIMLNPNQPSNAPSQLSENEISYKDEKQELHSPSGSSSNSQENTSNATNESKTQTVKREFVNINTKNTVTSHHKASTAVNAVDDIKFCLHDRPNKTELADNQDNPDYSLVKKGTTKDICETILQDISRGKQLLGQSEDISTKGKHKLYSEVTAQLLTNQVDLSSNDELREDKQVGLYSSPVSKLSCINPITKSSISTDQNDVISFLLALTSKEPSVVNTQENEHNVGLYDMPETSSAVSTPPLKASSEELTLEPLDILHPVVQFPTANSIQTNSVLSSFPFLSDFWAHTEKLETTKDIKQELAAAKNDKGSKQSKQNDSKCNLNYCLSLIGELCSKCSSKANQKNVDNSEVLTDRTQPYNIFGPSTEPSPNLDMCLQRPNKAERPHYTFLALKNDKPTADSIFNAELKTVNKHQKQTLSFVSGEPKSTDKKINQLLKKLAKTTTNPNILKTEINSKQRLKLGETNTSKAPLLQRILGGQSIQKSTKKPSQALGTEACIMIKTHPRRHKGGDPGNHFLHGKLITTVVCETAAKTSEHATVSHDEDKLQAAHQQTFAPEMKTISAKTCKNNICEECKFNDLKDILPQPPGKNYRYIVN